MGCTLLPNNLHQRPFPAAPIKFTIKYLFPWTKIKLSFGNGNYNFSAHNLTFHVGIGIVFARPVVLVLRSRGVRSELFQPDIETRLIKDGFIGGFSSGGRCFGLCGCRARTAASWRRLTRYRDCARRVALRRVGAQQCRRVSHERNFGNVTFNVIQNPPNYAVVAISGSSRSTTFARISPSVRDSTYVHCAPSGRRTPARPTTGPIRSRCASG